MMGLQMMKLHCHRTITWDSLREAAQRIDGLPLSWSAPSGKHCDVVFVDFPESRVSITLDVDSVFIADYSMNSPVLVDVIRAAAIELGAVAEFDRPPRYPMPVTHQAILDSHREVRSTVRTFYVCLIAAMASILGIIVLVAWWIWRLAT